jgi:paraquat-inducible protein B
MSKPVNPMAIGSFVVGGIVLLITALLVFGGGQFFKPRIHWVVYFNTSLNGLNVGAPVKVQGVQVGIVKEIKLQFDGKSQRLWKPVVLEIEPWRLAKLDGEPVSIPMSTGRHEEVRRLIETGLKARLEVQSILTGLLYVDLDFRPDQQQRLTGLNFEGLPEVPSVPPTVDEVMSTMEDVVKKIRNMPLDAMVNDIAATLADIRRLVGSDETRQSQAALTRALVDAQVILAELEKQLPSLMKTMDQTSRDIGVTARETSGLVHELRGQTGPVMKAAEQMMLQASTALDSAKGAASNIADATSSDSGLQEAVVELRNAAQSIRNLTDYLERHPDAVLFGKPD